MHNSDLSHPINHVFVDFENIHEVDLAIIGNKAVSFTLLVGSRQTKLDACLVEKLLEHATSVQLVRLTSGGKNALDFVLAYHVGRAAAADPAGFFHIVSKDTGFDPLIEHLKCKQIRARRHDSFATLTFASSPKLLIPPTPVTPSKLKSLPPPKALPSILDARATQVLEHLRKISTTRPRNSKKLVSFCVAYLGKKITEEEALKLVGDLSQAGHLAIGEKIGRAHV